MEIDLRTGQKRLDADIYHHAAFDARDDLAFDALLFLVELFQLFPNLHLVGFLFGQHEIAVCVFAFFDVDLEPVADFHVLQFFGRELIAGNHSLRFVTDIDDDLILGERHHTAFGDRALFQIAECFLVQRGQRVAV